MTTESDGGGRLQRVTGYTVLLYIERLGAFQTFQSVYHLRLQVRQTFPVGFNIPVESTAVRATQFHYSQPPSTYIMAWGYDKFNRTLVFEQMFAGRADYRE